MYRVEEEGWETEGKLQYLQNVFLSTGDWNDSGFIICGFSLFLRQVAHVVATMLGDDFIHCVFQMLISVPRDLVVV